jgi:glycosyltransferase involved in cell wall biosynthesis
MRIAYLVHGVDGAGSGVRSKILSQAATWSALAGDVCIGIFVRCESGAEPDWVGQPHVVKVRSSAAGVPGRLLQRELLSLEVAMWRPDLIYMRQSTVSPSTVGLALMVPTIVELNTLDLAELRMRSWPRYVYAIATRGLVLRAARGIVVVADEIGRHETVRRLGRPTVTIPNSIDLASSDPMPAPTNSEPRLAFLGAPRLPWHGLDKIGRLALRFPSWNFDIIGPGPEELTDAPPNVHFHGLLVSDDYVPILAHADVAIGPLALHRKQMQEASPLKVAEYLARGIPVIIGYTDGRFPTGAPFLLRIPNEEGNVEASFDAIEAFVNRWRGRRIDRASISGIDSLEVEQRRLDFMRSLARGPQTSWAGR